MSTEQLQVKAGDDWYGSRELQRQYATPEFYWWKRYQRVYCPECRADWSLLDPWEMAPRKHSGPCPSRCGIRCPTVVE